MTLVRYAYGPFSPLLCQIEYLVRNVFVLKMMWFVTFIITTRYIFIVFSKNPTAIQEDFWCLFLELWSMGKLVLRNKTF